VLLDAAAAFIIAGKARSLGEGAEMALDSIASGKAAQPLEKPIARGKA
jgi:anthranilate phosphoribosyltransferase